MKETKELLDFVLSLGNGIISMAEDKFSLSNLSNIIRAFKKREAAFNNVALVMDELKNATDAEREDLKIFIATTFDITSDDVEAVVEQCMDVAVDLSAILSLFIKPSVVVPPEGANH